MVKHYPFGGYSARSASKRRYGHKMDGDVEQKGPTKVS